LFVNPVKLKFWRYSAEEASTKINIHEQSANRGIAACGGSEFISSHTSGITWTR